MTHALIFANGDIYDGPMVQRALSAAVDPLVIAADGGARVAQHFGLHIQAVVGDFDSLSQQELDALLAQEAEVQRHPPEKDFTDLELALHYASDCGAEWIRVIGSLGDRLDQVLANVYVLALPVLEDLDVRLVAGRQETRLLRPGSHVITGTPGDTISLVPLGGNVLGVRTENLYYPLDGETLYFGPARGISNLMQEETATVSVGEGLLLLVHTVGRA